MSAITIRNPFESLCPEIMVQILQHVDNPWALSAVSSTFEQLLSDSYVSLRRCGSLNSRLWRTCWMIYGDYFPEIPASKIQKALYLHLQNELKILQLSSDMTGFRKTDIISYEKAERLICAKNLCLFAQHIGLSDKSIDLADPKKILREAQVCYDKLMDPSADFTQILSLDLRKTRITRITPETFDEFPLDRFPNLLVVEWPEPNRVVAKEREGRILATIAKGVLGLLLSYVVQRTRALENLDLVGSVLCMAVFLLLIHVLGESIGAEHANHF